MKTLIIGANGKIGRHLARKMAKNKYHEPIALIRKKEQRDFFNTIGVETIVEDLENPEEQIRSVMEGMDSVVFTAGSGADTGYDKTLEVDLYGAVKAIEAAEEKGVKRFVMVSAAGSGDSKNWPDKMRPYYIAKQLADRELRRSKLDYTILRPVRLTDEDDEGKLKISSDPKALNTEIPRIAVAETIVRILNNEMTHGKIMEMSQGEAEIQEAIEEFVSWEPTEEVE